jgi:O-acetylhomoserine/O-acetylserine sulfhydrylase-like pyridoxal-dependent enzyme
MTIGKAGARFATRAARGAPAPASASRPLTPPIHLANVYVFDDLAEVDAIWEGRRPGYVYGRFGTPNHTMLEETLAGLEGAEAALVTASGMGALTAMLLAALRPGEHLWPADLYGSTTALLRSRRRWGSRSARDATETAAVEAALTPATRAIFVEPSRTRSSAWPTCRGCGAGAASGLPLLVDATSPPRRSCGPRAWRRGGPPQRDEVLPATATSRPACSRPRR